MNIKKEVYEKPFYIQKYHKIVSANLKKYLNKKTKILELGLGKGEFFDYIKQKGEYYGIDIIKEHINKCRKKGIKAIRCDLNKKIPYSSKKFDIVIALELLEHLFNYELLIKEIKRVLKKNGVFFVSVPNSCYWRTILSFIRGDVPGEFTVSNHVTFFSLNQWGEIFKRYFKNVVLLSNEIFPNYFSRYAIFKCI